MNQIREIAHALYAGLDTPVSLKCSLLLKYGETRQLLECTCDPSDYNNPETYFLDAQACAFLKKAPAFSDDCPSEDRLHEEAAARLVSVELHNKRTSDRLSRFLPENLLIEDAQEDAIFTFIGEWRKDIAAILRGLPDAIIPSFSGGSTLSDSGEKTTIPDKLSSSVTYYPSSSDLLKFIYETHWGSTMDGLPSVVRGNRFFTVPKSALKRRSCCVEASANISLQLAVGRCIEDRLSRALGWSIRSAEGPIRPNSFKRGYMDPCVSAAFPQARLAKELHMATACASSSEVDINREISTIDLSSASDTVTRTLCKLVLPGSWFQLLDSLRAPLRNHGCGKEGVRGWHHNQLMSSMGNGYTFPLETLLFWTLCRTVVRLQTDDDLELYDISVFGDDMLVPARYSRDIVAALEYFGFVVNSEKSFLFGQFKESCGGDYFDGTAVRPYYLENSLDEPQDWIALANGLRRVANGNRASGSRWPHFRDAWRLALAHLPSNIRRCEGPESLGDIVIHTDRWKRSVRFRPVALDSSAVEEAAYETVKAYTPVTQRLPLEVFWWPDAQIASLLLGVPSTGVSPRDTVDGYKFRHVVVPYRDLV